MNMGGIVKTLRRSNSLSRSVFSTMGSLGWGGGLPREGVETKKFGMPRTSDPSFRGKLFYLQLEFFCL